MTTAISTSPMETPKTGSDSKVFSPSLLSRFWYELGLHATSAALTLGFSLRAAGSHQMPRQGPVLVISNHQSFLDPVMVGIAVRRHLTFLARKTLFRHRLFDWIIRSYNSVPIDQEGVGKDGIKTIVEQLRQEHAVLVFPEGERTFTGNMMPLKPGVHLLIRRAESVIVPVGVAGAFDAYPRIRPYPTLAPLFLPARKGTIAVQVGAPVDSRRYADLPREQALRELFDLIQVEQRKAESLRRQ